MGIISNNQGGSSAFAMVLFLMLLVTAALSIAAVGPVMDSIDSGFDDAYQSEYMTTSGASTVTTIYDSFGWLFPVLLVAGFIMVIVASIRRDEEEF